MERTLLMMHVQVNPQFYAFRWITLLLTQVGWLPCIPTPERAPSLSPYGWSAVTQQWAMLLWLE